jgi:hypothetical protein
MNTVESLRIEAEARRAMAQRHADGPHVDSIAQYVTAQDYADPRGRDGDGPAKGATTVSVDETIEPDRAEASRERAVKRLKKRRDFYGHLLVYALINGFLVAIWAVINIHGFFWPIFPILGWGVAVVLNAWDVYRNDWFTEAQIQREMEHLSRRR